MYSLFFSFKTNQFYEIKIVDYNIMFQEGQEEKEKEKEKENKEQTCKIHEESKTQEHDAPNSSVKKTTADISNLVNLYLENH